MTTTSAGSGDAVAGQYSFRVVAILPAVLLLVFGAIWLREKSQGGFKATKITAVDELGKPLTSESCSRQEGIPLAFLIT